MHKRFRVAAKVVGRQHDPQRAFDGPARIGQERRDAMQRLVFFGVEHMQNSACQQGMGRFLPVVAPLAGAVGIDQDIGDVLDIAHLGRTLAHFEQRIEPR